MDQEHTTPVYGHVLVVGDVVLAWDMLHPSGKVNRDLAYDADEKVTVYRQTGGAWGTTETLKLLVDDAATSPSKITGHPRELQVHGIALGLDTTPEPLGSVAQAYHLWSLFPRSRKDDDNKHWRIAGYLGTQKASGATGDHHKTSLQPSWPEEADPRVRLFVVVDDNMGFRDAGVPELAQKLTALAGTPEKLPWFVWKQRGIKQDIHLLRSLTGKSGQQHGPDLRDAMEARAIAVVSATELRKSAHRISADRSWEGVAQEAFNAVLHAEHFKKLARVVVSFATAGALVVRPREKTAFLVYDPNEMEGTWFASFPGDMVGLTTCVLTEVIRSMMNALKGVHEGNSLEGSDVDGALMAAVEEGVIRARMLHLQGYANPRQAADKLPEQAQTRIDQHNPTNRVLCSAKPGAEDEHVKAHKLRPELWRVDLPSHAPTGGAGEISSWTILNAARSKVSPASQSTAVAEPGNAVAGPQSESSKLLELARKIVTEGVEVGLEGIPRARYGKLTTADRHEIDSLRAIAGLFDIYLHSEDARPISIAVFGPPGSGKSFTVKQIAEHLGRDRIGGELTFNLSQLDQPSALIGAFHQIRDEALRGKPPLVFWDEFDTPLDGKQLGWLRSFLAPMQDGHFQEGQVTHPIGRALFVFAGGTHGSFEDFRRVAAGGAATERDTLNAATSQRPARRKKGAPAAEVALRKSDPAKEADALETAKAAKVPDFLSRLRGSLDVRGIDARGDGDQAYLIRRALLLHGLLRAIMPGIKSGKGFDVDPKVLDALLRLTRYRYGARSMEALLRMSNVRGMRSLGTSCLPSATQMELHVDSKALLAKLATP